jgi:hypothetical protein
MNQLKLIPPSNVLPLKAARVLRGEAKENDHLPGATQPPLPLTPQRLELIKAYGKPPSNRHYLSEVRLDAVFTSQGSLVRVQYRPTYDFGSKEI